MINISFPHRLLSTKKFKYKISYVINKKRQVLLSLMERYFETYNFSGLLQEKYLYATNLFYSH